MLPYTIYIFIRNMHEFPQIHFRVDMAGRCTITEDVRPHQHATWEIVYFLEGQGKGVIGDEVVEAEAGTALITPPRLVHYEIPLRTFECLYIGLEAAAEQLWPRVYYDDVNHTFGNLCAILVREWNGRDAGGEKMVALLAHQLDTLLQRTYAKLQLSPTQRLVRAAEFHLEQRFAASLTIEELAKELGVSRSFLDTQFLRLRGQTPMAYLQTLRVQHAVAMIRNSTLSLEAIAGLCGYYSASHLSRKVKHATGKSPGSFRTR